MLTLRGWFFKRCAGEFKGLFSWVKDEWTGKIKWNLCCVLRKEYIDKEVEFIAASLYEYLVNIDDLTDLYIDKQLSFEVKDKIEKIIKESNEYLDINKNLSV